MDPVTKRQKLSVETMDMKEEEEGEQLVDDGIDRISNLPPDIIGKILSLLPTTKEAVATCVLSPTWKWFWTFITRLNFIDHSSPDFSKPSFIDFIHRLLLYRKPTTLDYFHIHCYELDNVSVSHLREWLSAALMVGVEELNLSIFIFYKDNVPSNILPSELFSSKKLLKLTLGGHFTIDIPATVCLANLQALVLDTIQFRDDSSLKRLLIGCPALEELEVYSSSQTRHVLPQELFSLFTKLAKLQLEVYFVMNVPALVSLPSLEAMHLANVIFPDDDSVKRLLRGCPSLRELELNINCLRILHVDAPFLSKLTVTTYWGPCDGGKLVLETPSLRYLKVDGLAADACELTDVSQLVEAELYDISYPHGYKAVNDLITGLSNVKTLYLSGSVMEAIANGGCEPRKFHKLTTLKLGMNYDIGWAAIPVLLKKSPFLETLVFLDGVEEHFKWCPLKESRKNSFWHAPQNVPYCLLHHLKVIEIYNFGGDIKGQGLIRYFIENRGVLNDLTIIQHFGGSGAQWANRKTVYHRRRSGQEATKKL